MKNKWQKIASFIGVATITDIKQNVAVVVFALSVIVLSVIVFAIVFAILLLGSMGFIAILCTPRFVWGFVVFALLVAVVGIVASIKEKSS